MTYVGAPAVAAPPIVAGASSRARAGGAARGRGAGAELYIINYGIGRLYDATLGPFLRQTTQKAFGQKYTPPYVPPRSIGFLAREMVYGGLSFLVGKAAFGMLVSNAQGAGKALNPLLTSGGIAGASAGAAAAQGITTMAFRGLVMRSLVMTSVFTALDAMFAATVGPKVESGVNGIFGKKESTTTTNIRGGVPLNTVKVTFEQGTRNFARSFLGGLTYTIALREFGMLASKAVFAGLGVGPVGAIVGALSASLVAAAVTGIVMSAIETPAADMAQKGVRLLKKSLGKKLDPQGAQPDVVATPGDRLNGSVRSVALPYVTAALTGNQAVFMQGLTGVAPPAA